MPVGFICLGHTNHQLAKHDESNAESKHEPGGDEHDAFVRASICAPLKHSVTLTLQ
jgi:hypothetical protein